MELIILNVGLQKVIIQPRLVFANCIAGMRTILSEKADGCRGGGHGSSQCLERVSETRHLDRSRNLG